MKRFALFLTGLMLLVVGQVPLSWGENIEIYIDVKTKQLFAEPGPGRTKLGTFAPVPEPVLQDRAPRSLSEPISPTAPPPLPVQNPPLTPIASTGEGTKAVRWFEKLTLRGQMQFRYTGLLSDEGSAWFHPSDPSVGDKKTIIIRRGRLILSGDLSKHLYVYIQPDFMASPAAGDYSLQIRDLYADIAVDERNEFRFRLGQSKVPFGFVNLQSSRNRLAMEGPDALNSAVEGGRDSGAYFMWASEESRRRFKALVSDGLKGSGDYGVFALGGYGGQGPNRSDQNDQFHLVARLTYPFLLPSGQFFEAGLQGYTGDYVPRTSEFVLNEAEGEVKPSFAGRGVRDRRVGMHAVLYPQPLGIEVEWNVGRGPELSKDFRTIDDEDLEGGYVQATYKLDTSKGIFFPFVRYQHYDGGRKFGRNSPHAKVNEWDLGVEWQIWPEVEVTAMYTFSSDRTNSSVFPYETLQDGSRLAVQLQVNY